jgi:hypothetical protein
MVQPLHRLFECADGLSSGSGLMDDAISLIPACGLIGWVGVFRCIRPSLSLRSGQDTLQFGDATFKELLELISFLPWEHIRDLDYRA